jgi:hypothetical protein
MAQTLAMFNRRRPGDVTLFLGVLTVIGVVGAAARHSAVGVLIAVVLFGVPFAFLASPAMRRRPALVIDQHSLTEGRSGRAVAWDFVTAARVGVGRGFFAESHRLVLTILQGGPDPPRRVVTTNATNPDEVEIDLDWLSLPWREVVSLVEQGFGRRVVVMDDRG